MTRVMMDEVECLGGDPASEVWSWLIENGPHGNDFTWSQTRKEPAGFVGVELLEQFASELADDGPDFWIDARQAASLAMRSRLAPLIRRGIQVAAVVGGRREFAQISELTGSEETKVAADARAAKFYLKRKLGNT